MLDLLRCAKSRAAQSPWYFFRRGSAHIPSCTFHSAYLNVSTVSRDCIVGRSWDLVAIYNRVYNPIYSLPNWPYMDYPNYKQGYKLSYKQLLNPRSLQVEQRQERNQLRGSSITAELAWREVSEQLRFHVIRWPFSHEEASPWPGLRLSIPSSPK